MLKFFAFFVSFYFNDWIEKEYKILIGLRVDIFGKLNEIDFFRNRENVMKKIFNKMSTLFTI